MLQPRVWLVALIIALAGCAQLEDFDVSAPAWESGYEWTYDVRSQENLGPEKEGGTWSETLRVLRDEDTAAGEPVYLVAHSDDDRDTLLAFRASDLAPAYAMDPVLWDCDGPPACIGEIGDVEDDGFWPFPGLDFPLTDGKTWSATLEPGIALRAEVLGSRVAETQVGPLDAVLVRYTGSVSDSETYDGQTESFDISVQWDLYYSEAIRAIAISELTAHGRITTSESSGGVWAEEVVELEVVYEHVLSSYSLEAAPDMDGWELWEHFGMDEYSHNWLRIEHVDVPTTGAGEGDLQLSLRQDRLDDAVFNWTLSDASGVLETHVGKTLETTVPYGGVYFVDLVATRDGREVASTSDVIVTHLEDEASVDCDNLYVPGVPADACEEASFPVQPHATAVFVGAQPDGQSVDGVLRILDGDGAVLYEVDADDGYQVDVDDPEVGDWVLQFVPEQGLDVSVDYDWQVVYAVPPSYETIYS